MGNKLFELGYFSEEQVSKIIKQLTNKLFSDYDISVSGTRNQTITVSARRTDIPTEAQKTIFQYQLLSLLSN